MPKSKIILASSIVVVAIVGITFSNELLKRSGKRDIVEVEEDIPKPMSKRKPASQGSLFGASVPLAEDPQVSSSRSEGGFNQNAGQIADDVPLDSDNEGFDSVADVPNIIRPTIDSYPNMRSRSPRTPSSATTGTLLNNDASATTSQVMSGGVPFYGGASPFSNNGSSAEPDAEPSRTRSPGSTFVPIDDLSCSASVGGGVYGNPIQVTLGCSAAANIKYCIQEGSCCDPEQGLNYTGPIIIGEDSGNVCLSIYGKSEKNKVSEVTEYLYTINNTYPDLQLNIPKTYYQTTQLPGYHHLRSDDFSKNNFMVGEINLKSHDPGPSGLNWDCQDIVEKYVTLPAPAPTPVFTPMDMAAIALGFQLNVPLVLNKLSYGENFLTSYVVNSNYPAPLYSCSTNKVTLNDFEYFVPEVSHGDTGTNEVREFAGSFVSYSFFEEDMDIYRIPAGVANEEVGGQELRVGSFGVFY